MAAANTTPFLEKSNLSDQFSVDCTTPYGPHGATLADEHGFHAQALAIEAAPT